MPVWGYIQPYDPGTSGRSWWCRTALLTVVSGGVLAAVLIRGRRQR